MKNIELTIYRDNIKTYENRIDINNNLIQMVGLSIATRLLIEASVKFGVGGYLVYEAIKTLNWI